MGAAQGFDLHIVRRKIFNEEDAIAAVRELNDEAIDLTLLLAASVANGRAVVPFGRLNSRLGIWSLPESTSAGFLPMNSFCGSMIFAGILGQYPPRRPDQVQVVLRLL